jgi:hypothetical protein
MKNLYRRTSTPRECIFPFNRDFYGVYGSKLFYNESYQRDIDFGFNPRFQQDNPIIVHKQ